MQVSKTLLEDILRRYGCGEGRVNDLAKEAGMTPMQLTKLAKDQGFPSRAEQALAKRAAAKAERETAAELVGKSENAGTSRASKDQSFAHPPHPNPPPRRAEGSPSARWGRETPPVKADKTKPFKKKPKAKPPGLVQKFFDAIESELQKLDKQTGNSSQDRERASRTLKQMVSTLEKAHQMHREITKDKSRGGGAKDKELLAHAEDLRQRIAERIKRLRLSGQSGPSAKGDAR